MVALLFPSRIRRGLLPDLVTTICLRTDQRDHNPILRHDRGGDETSPSAEQSGQVLDEVEPFVAIDPAYMRIILEVARRLFNRREIEIPSHATFASAPNQAAGRVPRPDVTGGLIPSHRTFALKDSSAWPVALTIGEKAGAGSAECRVHLGGCPGSAL